MSPTVTTVVPGASYTSDPQWTSVVEVGRALSQHFSASLTVGLPPKAKAKGSGSIAGIGELGAATYGPAAVTVQYHFNPDGKLSPYVGAGGSYMHIFDTSDGVMTNLHIDDTFGPAAQIGVDYKINEHWGVFVDAKKAWLRTDATGTIGGIPATARMTFDPSVLNLGLGYTF